MYGNVRKVSRQDIKLVTVSPEMKSNNNLKNDLSKDSFYAGGLYEYISLLNADKKPLHDVICFRKEINGITLDIGLQWCLDGYSDKMLGYANSIRTIDGGTHIDGVKASITRTLNIFLKKSKFIKEKDITLSEEHCREGLTCIVSVVVPNPEFEGHTQTRLGNPYVQEIVEQTVEEYLMEYFELHPDILDRIITKTFNAYKTALAVKKVNELFRSKSVPTPRTVLEKLTNSSSEKSGEGVSSSCGGAKHSPVPSRRLESKRKLEQPLKNDDGEVSKAPRVFSLENNNSVKKREKPTRSCVLSSKICYASTPPKIRKEVKTPKDVNRVSNEVKRPFIPIGPGFQAEIPVWVAPTKKGKFYGSPGDSNTLRWLGTGVWPTYSLKKKVYHRKIGQGRSDESCSCASPGSTNCIKLHVKESREVLEKDIGRAFFTWEFDKIGEEAVSKSWTVKEELRFENLVKKEPLSNSEGFWEYASKAFPRKSKKDILSYYYNVFLIKRMRTLCDNSSSDAHIDSDDDHNGDFLAG